MKTKFRAWDKYAQELVNVKTFDLEVDGSVGCIVDYSGINLDASECIIMQYTGLNGYMSDEYDDHQEKSVYKGDIVDIFWEDCPGGYYRENHLVGVVDIDSTGTSWVLSNAKYDSYVPSGTPELRTSLEYFEEGVSEEIYLHNFNLTSDDITILGNIYQNKELLEGE